MRYDFKKRRLANLYEGKKGARRLPPEVVDRFFEVMATIDAASDERDLYRLKGLHYHQLEGRRSHQHAVNLNRQWRLIIERQRDEEGRYLLIIDIEDYH